MLLELILATVRSKMMFMLYSVEGTQILLINLCYFLKIYPT